MNTQERTIPQDSRFLAVEVEAEAEARTAEPCTAEAELHTAEAPSPEALDKWLQPHT